VNHLTHELQLISAAGKSYDLYPHVLEKQGIHTHCNAHQSTEFNTVNCTSLCRVWGNGVMLLLQTGEACFAHWAVQFPGIFRPTTYSSWSNLLCSVPEHPELKTLHPHIPGAPCIEDTSSTHPHKVSTEQGWLHNATLTQSMPHMLERWWDSGQRTPACNSEMKDSLKIPTNANNKMTL